jgi:glycosyltransferase involved in cell wall biosynthesis
MNYYEVLAVTSPLVSVVVPTLRRPAYLALTLQSVWAQTYEPLEIIVSDNGSGDQTPDVVAQFSSPKLRFRQNPTATDLYTHLNQCLAEVRGKYYVVISDDDLIDPDFVASHVAILEARQDVTVSLAHCEIIDNDGHVTKDLGVPGWETYAGIEFLLDWLELRCSVYFRTLFSMFVRTALVKQNGGYPVFRGTWNSDNAVFIRLALQGDVGFAREALFQYRVHGGSYGLSTAHTLLAQSMADFVTYLNNDASMIELFSRLPASQARAIRQGAAQGAINYYLRFLARKSAAGMPVADLIRGLRAYSPSSAYLRALCRFPLYLTKQILSRWGLAAKWPPT